MMLMRRHAPLETTAASRAFDRVRAAALSPVSIAVLSAACFAIRLLRHHAGIGPHYSFVGTNLLLAWIPLLLAYGVSWSARSRSRWAALPPLAVLWMLFLPNAPYLVTDLVHLKDGVSAVNVVLLSLLALIGVLIGVKCVQLVQRAVEQLFGVKVGRRAVQVIAVLTAVGVYLGRVLRWNSWTVLHDPGVIAHAVLRSPSEPARVGLALLATVLFSLGFLAAYRVLAGPPEVRLARGVRSGTTP
jgi:uncharacterized membrane protein